MMIGLARIVVVIFALMLVVVGLWLASYGNEGDAGLVVAGLITALIGVIGIAVLAFERMRYRSAATEVPPTVGSAAGETPGALLDPRFRPTDEVFVDPSSGKRTRVFADPDTGERRYQPEA
jgi:hypothetical protein